MLVRCRSCIVLRLASRSKTPHSFSIPFPRRQQLRNKRFTRNYTSSAAQANAPSTSALTAGAAVGATAGGVKEALYPLDELVNKLDSIAPRFEIDAEDIEILIGPAEFYEALKTKISKAERRIYLSTLYVGKTEYELVSTIREALKRNSQLQVSVLTDALRGTREAPKPSCASLLAPLIEEFGPERVEIRLYHTPNLTGLRKRLIPNRVNEGWGLQHMKLYGVDDEIIMSGANLSDDYFTNRQDRYHVFRSKAITDYYAGIHHAVCSISYSVQPWKTEAGFVSEWPASNSGPSPLDDPNGYRSNASSLLGPLIAPRSWNGEARGDTVVYPLFQLTPFLKDSAHNSTEMPALHHVLSSLQKPAFKNSRVTFTAGYFNPTKQLTSLLLANIDSTKTDPLGPTPASLTVIAASPWANGFYGSAGISGMLPPAYTLLCRRFLEEVGRRGLNSRVKLLEWRKGTVGEPEGWTYHAKGLWITLPSAQPSSSEKEVEVASTQTGPNICLVGSSNYTARSSTLDLEANALIVTRNPGLQRRLAAEEKWLGKYAKEVGIDEYMKTERRVGLHVRVAMWIVSAVGGAL